MKYTALMNLRDQEKFDSAYTLNLSVGKNWYIHRIYQLGFSLEVKNILNDQTIRTGGYEQMRLSRRTYVNKEVRPPSRSVLRAVRFEVLLPAGDDLLPECIFPLLIRYDDYEKDISVMCRAGRDVCGYGVL